MTILGRSEELVSRCVECDLAEPESLASLGGSAPGVVDGILSTTEQLVLHFDEQFTQLDEISEDIEKLPSTVKVTLLQTAVRSINDLRIVETLDEFQSTTYGHGSSTSLS